MDLSKTIRVSAPGNIAKLVGKLRRRSSIRLWLEQNPDFTAASAETLFSALAQTKASDWVDHAVTYYLLGRLELPPRERHYARALLLDALLSPIMNGGLLQRLGKAFRAGFLGWMTVGMFVSIVMSVLTRTAIDLAGCTVLLLGILISSLFGSLLSTPFLFAGLSIRDTRRANKIRRVAAAALAQVGDPTCIVPLYRHVPPPSTARKEARKALLAILPQVTACWYGQMPPGSNAALVGLAKGSGKISTDDDLALAALDALEQAGDGNCAKAVERIAARATAARVGARATAILPTLIARRAQEEAASTLLRPSDNTQTQHLVRPVYGLDPNVTNLLRASHAESLASPVAPTNERTNSISPTVNSYREQELLGPDVE